MPNDSSRVATAEAVARAWDAAGVTWVVAHGAEAYPEALGRDLDVLVAGSDVRRALEIGHRVVSSRGWSAFVCPPPTWGQRLVALSNDQDGNINYFELHLITRLTWRTATIVGDAQPWAVGDSLIHRSPWISLAKGVLTPLLAGDMERLDYEYLRRHAPKLVDRATVLQESQRLLGDRLGCDVLDMISAGDHAALARTANQLRRHLYRRMIRYPRSTLENAGRLARRTLRRTYLRSGIHIQVAPPCAATPSELSAPLADHLRRVFVGCVIVGPRRFPQRLLLQFRFLSRQIAIIEVAPARESSDKIGVSVIPGVRRTGKFVYFQDGPRAPRDIADWTISQWAHSHPCPKT